MNGLLDKFKNVVIENSTRISIDDMKYCREQYSLYTNAHTAYTKALEELMKCWEIQGDRDYYMSAYGDCGIRKMQDAIVNTTGEFISKTIWYFENKYNLKLNSHYDKYDRFNHYHDNIEKLDVITVDFVLDLIFAQLDGLSFKELGLQQMLNENYIKGQSWNTYRKHWNYEIKGKTIKFRTSVDNLQPVLYYYDNNEIDMIDCYIHNKIDDYRTYENGNTDIKFYKEDYALEFATKYLGYLKMTESQKVSIMES